MILSTFFLSISKLIKHIHRKTRYYLASTEC